MCGPCAGYPVDYRCATCGRTGYLHGKGRCAYCFLDIRLRALLAGPNGEVSPQLLPLVQSFAQVSNPSDAIERCANSPALHLLGLLAHEGQPLNHALLDTLGSGGNVNYLRDLLIHTGVLPQQSDDIERLPAWLEGQLAQRPAHHGRLLRPFLHWFLLKRARRRATMRRQPASDEYGLRARIGVAFHLLDWLDERQLALEDLRQEHLDAWLADGTTYRRGISHFLTWTNEHKLTKPLTVPSRAARQPADFLDEDLQWPLLQRCLTDEDLPLDTRCVGALTLLYGLPLQRLRHLTTDQLDHREGGRHLPRDRHTARAAPAAALLARLAADPFVRRRPAFQDLDVSRSYLFPGISPGRPATPQTLRTHLTRLGITARPTRNAALAALAADLPAVVVADYLGMHISTTTRWVNYIRKDWAAYVAVRAEDNRAGSNGTGIPTLVRTTDD